MFSGWLRLTPVCGGWLRPIRAQVSVVPSGSALRGRARGRCPRGSPGSPSASSMRRVAMWSWLSMHWAWTLSRMPGNVQWPVRIPCTASRRPPRAARAADSAATPTLPLTLPLRSAQRRSAGAKRRTPGRPGDRSFRYAGRFAPGPPLSASARTCQERLRRPSDRLRRLLTEPGRESRSSHLSGAGRGAATPLTLSVRGGARSGWEPPR